jgi:hypothetical protein
MGKVDWSHYIKTENISSRRGNPLWSAKVRVWEYQKDKTIEIHPNELLEEWGKTEEEARAKMETKILESNFH